jgi:hypothetical protein
VNTKRVTTPVTDSAGVYSGSTKESVTKAATVDGVDTTNANRINVIAVEDLGGGLKFTGRVDNRLTPTNTARNTGDMFVQVEGGFGTIKVGQYTFASHAAWNAGEARTVSSTSTTAQSLSANVMAYTTPNIAGLTASAALDLDTSSGSAGKDGWGLKFNYATGPLAAQLSYTVAAKATAAMTPVRVTGLAATYDFGMAKVFYNQTDVRAGNNAAATTADGYFAASASNNGTTAGASTTVNAYVSPAAKAGAGSLSARKGFSLSVAVPVGAATLKAGMINNKGDSNVTIIDRATVGVDYALSKRTTLVAEFGQDKQAVTGLNRTTNSFVGVNHSF